MSFSVEDEFQKNKTVKQWNNIAVMSSRKMKHNISDDDDIGMNVWQVEL